jgi:hypothetical protein
MVDIALGSAPFQHLTERKTSRVPKQGRHVVHQRERDNEENDRQKLWNHSVTDRYGMSV